MKKCRRILLVTGFLAATLMAQNPAALSPEVRSFISVDAPVVALTHVRLIDGTGASARDDQTIVISGGKIQAVGAAASTSVPAGAKVMDLRGYSVIPGLVGMHDHMFYTAGIQLNREGHLAAPGYLLNEVAYSFPRLYLAGGVTSLRTTGSLEPYTDLNLKQAIDAGKAPGPKLHVTGPYLEGSGTDFLQMHQLRSPEEARRFVDYWADQDVTSFKAYMNITRAELGAAIEEAHKRGIKVTGHLCSVTWREAAALGIDDLEHGPLFVDTEFVANKQPDVCPPEKEQVAALLKQDVDGPAVQAMLHDLVQRHVAVTSTLAVFEAGLPDRPPLRREVLESMAPDSRISYLTERADNGRNSQWSVLFKKELQFEHEFAKAGGLLLAGNDPTGDGGVLAGFGDQREVELLVEAGFTPEEAIHIASANGAQFLGEADHIGTIAPGKQADLVVIHGDPSKKIADIEKVETVFKDGIGYDSHKLIESVRGVVGLR